MRLGRESRELLVTMKNRTGCMNIALLCGGSTGFGPEHAFVG